MKFSPSILFFLVFLTFFNVRLSANHLLGSDFHYKFVGFNSKGSEAILEIQFSLYRDGHSNNLNTADFIDLAIYKDDVNKSIYRTKSIKANYLNKLIDLKNPKLCYYKADVKVLEDFYTDTIHLPVGTEGYHIVYSDCCREFEDNIVSNPGNNAPGQSETPGIASYLFYANNAQINHSASFDIAPYFFICAGMQVDVPFPAQDIDGDSLAYFLVQPYDSIKFFRTTYPNTLSLPLKGIPYKTGFSAENIFGPGGISSIDSKTGTCTFRSNNTGEYALAVEIKEYRNGILISTVRKDILLYVDDCPTDLPSIETGCESEILIPSAFSPNGDGINELFTVQSKYINEFTIQIFSRWGQLVYESDNVGFNWDGTFNGAALNPGVFAVLISGKGLDGNVFLEKKLLSLVK